MLKVLIADDEAKVCQLICHLVDWGKFGMEIVDVVHDGESALCSIEKNSPDVVVTDIRMPAYDGIELIGQAKESNPNIYFIIISGYSQFEYAKQAIKYGVENYLLKPLKKKELEEALGKIVEKHRHTSQITTEREELMERLHESQQKNKRSLIQTLMEDRESKTPEWELNQLNTEYSCHFGNDGFLGVVILPFIMQEGTDRQVYELLLNKISQILESRLSPLCSEMICAAHDQKVVCAAGVVPDKLLEIKKQLYKLRMEIVNWKEIFENVEVVIGIGRIKQEARMLAESIEEANAGVLNRMVLEHKNIIDYADCITAQDMKQVPDKEEREELLGCLERIDIAGLRKVIERIREDLSQPGFDGARVFACYKELTQLLIFGSKSHLSEQIFPEQTVFIQEFENAYSLDRIFNWLSSYIAGQLSEYLEKRKNSNTIPIRQAKQYIAERYQKNISLEEVSSLVGFNPAYFSSLFKKETGKNFTEYLMEVRVQNAKNLIVRSNMDIGDVAVEVGYSDFKYFSKVFKRTTGVNPSDYRKLYG